MLHSAMTAGLRHGSCGMVRVKEEKKLGLGFLMVWMREDDEVSYFGWVF